MGRFASARLKIEWANHHIARLETLITSLGQSDVASVEINPLLGNEIIKHDIADRGLINEIALITGDAVHNLKCALDHAWIETITRLVPTAVSRFAKFPVYPTHDALKSALRGNGIDQAVGGLSRIILFEIRPYAGGNHAIWPIHRLDIRDKHQLLVPVILYSSISGIETQDQTGEVSRNSFTSGTHQSPPWYIPMPLGVHVSNAGKVSFSVSFEYEDVGNEIVFADALRLYSYQFARVLERLEELALG